jgi:hypothetical protein
MIGPIIACLSLQIVCLSLVRSVVIPFVMDFAALFISRKKRPFSEK